MDKLRIFEVSLRDGLQNEPTVVPTAAKLAYLQQLIDAGFTDIEVTSFVRPRWIPALADADELAQNLPEAPGVRFWGLVPNPRGLDRALEAGMGHIATFLSSSESHNRANVNRTIAESLAGIEKVIVIAKSEGMQVKAYISTVFGCPFEGDVDLQATIDIAQALYDVGADQITLGDTIGVANPRQVHEVVTSLVDAGLPLEALGAHFHDTRGTALANAWAAHEAGIRSFDGSLAGIGGCPYAPGAAGNVATEDLVYLFHEIGAHTGVDLPRAARAGVFMEGILGRTLPGRYHQFWKGQGAEVASKTA